MTISLANLLLVVAALLGAVYFFLFFRLAARAPGQGALLVKSAPGKIANNLPALAAVALVVAPHSFKLVAAAVLFPALAIASVAQHRSLVRLGADPVFVKRLARTTALCFVAMSVFAGALFLGA